MCRSRRRKKEEGERQLEEVFLNAPEIQAGTGRGKRGKERQIEQHGTLSDRQSKAEWEAGRVDVSMIQQYSGRGEDDDEEPRGWGWG